MRGDGWDKLMRRVEALTKKSEAEAVEAKAKAEKAQAGDAGPQLLMGKPP